MTLFHQASYFTSVAEITQLPDSLAQKEVAFIGRSNAGKSSCLNALSAQKSLARTSKTPGRTQLINYFTCPLGFLVDLPGYGFAKVPLRMKQRWEQLINDYLQQRESLAGLVCIMDCRHPMTPLDQQLVQWSCDSQLPLHILLNKADKLSKNQQFKTLTEVKKQLASNRLLSNSLVSVQLFSASKKTGLPELQQQLSQWLQIEATEELIDHAS